MNVFNIRDYGATGNGKTLDSKAINKAIEACAKAGGGQVLLPPGRYLSGTVHLKSRVTLYLDAGARLVGTTKLDEYQAPKPPSFMPEAKWGKWHRALILADDLEQIAIAGPGAIDGNKVFDAAGEPEQAKKLYEETIALIRAKGIGVETGIFAARMQVFSQNDGPVTFLLDSKKTF